MESSDSVHRRRDEKRTPNRERALAYHRGSGGYLLGCKQRATAHPPDHFEAVQAYCTMKHAVVATIKAKYEVALVNQPKSVVEVAVETHLHPPRVTETSNAVARSVAPV